METVDPFGEPAPVDEPGWGGRGPKPKKTVAPLDTVFNAPTVSELEARSRAGEVLTEGEEQRIRDFYGYSKSEHRTKQERDAVAARIKARERTRGG